MAGVDGASGSYESDAGRPLPVIDEEEERGDRSEQVTSGEMPKNENVSRNDIDRVSRVPEWYTGGDVVALKMAPDNSQTMVLPCPFIRYTAWVCARPELGKVSFTTREKRGRAKDRGKDVFKETKIPVFEVFFIESCKKSAPEIEKKIIIDYMLEYTMFPKKMIRKCLKGTSDSVRVWREVSVESYPRMKNFLKRAMLPFFEANSYYELVCHFRPHGVYYLSEDMRMTLIRILRSTPHVFCLPPLRDEMLTKWYIEHNGPRFPREKKKRGVEAGRVRNGGAKKEGPPERCMTTRYPWTPVFRHMTDGKSADWLRCITTYVGGDTGEGGTCANLERLYADYSNMEFKAVNYGKYLFNPGVGGGGAFGNSNEAHRFADSLRGLNEIGLLYNTADSAWTPPSSKGSYMFSHINSMEFGIVSMLAHVCSGVGVGTHNVELYNVEESAGRGKILKDSVLNGAVKGVLFMSATLETCQDLKDSGLGTSMNVYSIQSSPKGLDVLLWGGSISTIVLDCCHWVSDYAFYMLSKLISDVITAGMSPIKRLVLMGNAYFPYGSGIVARSSVFNEMWNSYIFTSDMITFPRTAARDLSFLRVAPINKTIGTGSERLNISIVYGSVFGAVGNTGTNTATSTSKAGECASAADSHVSDPLRKALFKFYKETKAVRLSSQVVCSSIKLCNHINRAMYYARSSSGPSEVKKKEVRSSEWRWGQFRCGDKVIVEDCLQVGIVKSFQMGNTPVTGGNVRASAQERAYATIEAQYKDMGHVSCCNLKSNSVNLAVHTVRHAECLTPLNFRRNRVKRGMFVVTKETTRPELEFFICACTDSAVIYAESDDFVKKAMERNSIQQHSDLEKKLQFLFKSK